jgi:type II secretory pathway pseudopilin PulG
VVSARGYALLVLLIAIATLAVGSTTFLRYYSEDVRREREIELLHVGQQIRAAIGNYYEASPGTMKRYPASLKDLTQDDRFVGIRRHLRRLYADPISGDGNWGLVPAPDGGIMGVYSLSERPLQRRTGFPAWLKTSAPERVSDLKFTYEPNAR